MVRDSGIMSKITKNLTAEKYQHNHNKTNVIYVFLHGFEDLFGNSSLYGNLVGKTEKPDRKVLLDFHIFLSYFT